MSNFAILPTDPNGDIISSINYLLATQGQGTGNVDFGNALVANVTSGQITTGVDPNYLAYLYQYMDVRYADSADGVTNFSTSPTNRTYFGVRNFASYTPPTSNVEVFTSTQVWTCPSGVNNITLFMVGGGGAGGSGGQGGGGGGGAVYQSSSFPVVPGTNYTVTVGAGGAPSLSAQANGSPTTFSFTSNSTLIYTAMGGGGGGGELPSGNVASVARNGGSGGGGSHPWNANGTNAYNTGANATAANTIQFSTYGYGQGTNGGEGRGQVYGIILGGYNCTLEYILVGGGGGGANVAGSNWNYKGTPTNITGIIGGNGGAGFGANISNNLAYYGGGGGGGLRIVQNSLGSNNYIAGAGGIGGGQGNITANNGDVAGGGNVNTGGGGAGVFSGPFPTVYKGGAGGSGIVYMSYTRTYGSDNPADYVWTQVAGGGFGTTRSLYYQTNGGRQIQFAVATTPPSDSFVIVTDNVSIDLDILSSTLAAVQSQLQVFYSAGQVFSRNSANVWTPNAVANVVSTVANVTVVRNSVIIGQVIKTLNYNTISANWTVSNTGPDINSTAFTFANATLNTSTGYYQSFRFNDTFANITGSLQGTAITSGQAGQNGLGAASTSVSYDNGQQFIQTGTTYSPAANSAGYLQTNATVSVTRGNATIGSITRQISYNTLKANAIAANTTGNISGGTTNNVGSYTFRTFTSNGTFTVTSANAAVDLIVVGAGQRGSLHPSDSNWMFPGGNGGEVVLLSNVVFPAGSYNVTVGNGATGPYTYSNINAITSIGPLSAAGGAMTYNATGGNGAGGANVGNVGGIGVADPWGQVNWLSSGNASVTYSGGIAYFGGGGGASQYYNGTGVFGGWGGFGQGGDGNGAAPGGVSGGWGGGGGATDWDNRTSYLPWLLPGNGGPGVIVFRQNVLVGNSNITVTGTGQEYDAYNGNYRYTVIAGDGFSTNVNANSGTITFSSGTVVDMICVGGGYNGGPYGGGDGGAVTAYSSVVVPAGTYNGEFGIAENPYNWGTNANPQTVGYGCNASITIGGTRYWAQRGTAYSSGNLGGVGAGGTYSGKIGGVGVPASFSNELGDLFFPVGTAATNSRLANGQAWFGGGGTAYYSTSGPTNANYAGGLGGGTTGGTTGINNPPVYGGAGGGAGGIFQAQGRGLVIVRQNRGPIDTSLWTVANIGSGTNVGNFSFSPNITSNYSFAETATYADANTNVSIGESVTIVPSASGSRGFIPLAYVITASNPTSYTDAQYTAAFSASRSNIAAPIGTGFTPITGDTAQFFYPAGNVGVVKTYSSSTLPLWTTANGQVIDGNLIVTGTITAAQMNTNSLYTLNIQSTNAINGNTSSPGFWLQSNTGNARFGGNVSIGANLNVQGLITTGNLNNATVNTTTIVSNAISFFNGYQNNAELITFNPTANTFYSLTNTISITTTVTNTKVVVTGQTLWSTYANTADASASWISNVGIRMFDASANVTYILTNESKQFSPGYAGNVIQGDHSYYETGIVLTLANITTYSFGVYGFTQTQGNATVYVTDAQNRRNAVQSLKR